MVETTVDGEYLNIKQDGDIRVSISESHDEVLVYEDSTDEPIGQFTLSTGERKP
jgi:hypothetical protein